MAATLNGTSQYFRYPGTGAAEFGATQFTLSCWVNPTTTPDFASTGTGGITLSFMIAKGRAEADGDNRDMNYAVGIQSNYIVGADFESTLASNNNNPAVGSVSINNGAWFHIASTFNGTTHRVFRNGAFQGSRSTTQTPRSDSIQPFSIGAALTSAGAADGFWKGGITECAMWNAALDDTEIAELFQDGYLTYIKGTPLQLRRANLQGYWPFTEGADYSGSGALKDFSGNKRHLDATGTISFLTEPLTYKSQLFASTIYGASLY